MTEAAPDVLDEAYDLRARGQAFALATVVRTVAMTAAKAGAKAVIRADGSISAGWIGGGCARAAVLRAACDALADGQARLVSIQPEDALAEHHAEPGELRDGLLYARNTCPSRGTMDVFVEPVRPRPLVLVSGTSPVAVAVADLLPRFGFAVTAEASAAEQPGFAVVATQGRGDLRALQVALARVGGHVAFVGSHRKGAVLRAALLAAGADPERVARLRAPAGLDIGAVTPEEIALSIVAELVEVRRRGQSVRPATPPTEA